MSGQENDQDQKSECETNPNANEPKSETYSKVSHEYGRMMITKPSVQKIQNA